MQIQIVMLSYPILHKNNNPLKLSLSRNIGIFTLVFMSGVCLVGSSVMLSSEPSLLVQASSHPPTRCNRLYNNTCSAHYILQSQRWRMAQAVLASEMFTMFSIAKLCISVCHYLFSMILHGIPI